MCQAKPYPRCSSHARERLHAALNSGDKERIRKAQRDYYTSPAGIEELKESGHIEEAQKYEERRARLIAKAKKIEDEARAKPIRLGLDLDNTTGSFTAGLRNYMAQQMGLSPEEALKTFPDPTDYSFVKSGWFTSTEEFLRMKDSAEAAGVYRTMDLYPEAVATLKRLAKSGKVEIHVVTARDARFAEDTKAWLDAAGIPYKSVIHTEAKEETDLDVYLDDASSQLTKLREHGKKVIVFDQIYNIGEATKGMPRVKNWRRLPAILQAVYKQQNPELLPDRMVLSPTHA